MLPMCFSAPYPEIVTYHSYRGLAAILLLLGHIQNLLSEAGAVLECEGQCKAGSCVWLVHTCAVQRHASI